MTERADGLSHQLAQARRQRDELLNEICETSWYGSYLAWLARLRELADHICQEIEEEANDAEDEG